MTKTWIPVATLLLHCATAQQLPQQCTQISLFNACVTAGRQRVDACGQNLPGGVPNISYYDCQCKELTSIETCYTYCPDSPEIQAQLPNEVANAKAWCDTANTMRLNAPSSTTIPSSVVASTTHPARAPVMSSSSAPNTSDVARSSSDPVKTYGGPTTTSSASVTTGNPSSPLRFNSGQVSNGRISMMNIVTGFAFLFLLFLLRHVM